MKGKIWDLYTPIYSRAMWVEGRSYAFLYRHIARLVHAGEILELATGPGMLAKRIASVTECMLATDYSKGIIAEARKGICPKNLRFEVANTLSLPYTGMSFDAVIIMDTLHLLPESKFALREIARVLRPDSILVAPNFVKKWEHFVGHCWEAVLGLVGVQFEHQWTAKEYLAFLKDSGWKLLFYRETQARMLFLYTEYGRS